MKKPVQFNNLDKRRQMMLISNAQALAVAIQIIEKCISRQAARQIITGGLHFAKSLTDEEIAINIKGLDEKIENTPNITGIHNLFVNSQN